jgi:hypothetical protein
MLTWAANLYYFLVEIPAAIWRRFIGKHGLARWWNSHY